MGAKTKYLLKLLLTILLVVCIVSENIQAYAGDLRLSSSVDNSLINEAIETELITNIGSDDEIGTNVYVGEDNHEIQVTRKASTCSTKGYTTSVCKTVNNCKLHPKTKTELPLNKNNHETIAKETVSYCTANGYYREYCKSCQSTTYKVTLQPRGHHMEEVDKKEATYDYEGYIKYACVYDNCTYTDTKSIPRIERPATPSNPAQPSNPNPSVPPASGNESSKNNKPEEKTDNKIENTYGSDPVNLYTGAHEIDIEVLALGGASNISVGLKYKSDKVVEGIFGKGFYWNYESFVEEKGDEILVYHSPAEYVVYKKTAKEDKIIYVTKTNGNELDELTKNADGTITLKSNGKTFEFNKEGKLSKVISKTGKSVSLEYSETNIILKDDISGQTITLYLNTEGLVEKITNSSAEATIQYNSAKLLSRITDIDGYETTYTYDENAQVLTATDAEGNTYFTDEYNEYGRVIAQTDASNNKSYFEYVNNADDTRTVTLTDREGNKKVYTFDSVGRKLKEVNEEGNETSYTYDEKGNLIKVVDALNNEIKREYDARNNLVKEINPLGKETKYTYDSKDNLLSVTYPNGAKDTFKYNSKNQLTLSIDKRGLATTYKYDANGYLTKQVTSRAADNPVKKNIYHVHSGSETEESGCYGTSTYRYVCGKTDSTIDCGITEHTHSGTDNGTSPSGCHTEAYTVKEAVGTSNFVANTWGEACTVSCLAGCKNIPAINHMCVVCRRYVGTEWSCPHASYSYSPHTHSETVYKDVTRYKCTKAEHTHTEECKHTHSEVCKEQNYTLNCGKTTSTVEGTISALGGKAPKITATGSVSLKGYSWSTTDGKIESGATSSTCKTSKPGTYKCKVSYEDLNLGENKTVTLTVITYDLDYISIPFEARTATYTYEKGNVKTITDSYGNTTTFKYDTNDHLVETITPDGAKTTNKVSNYGSVLSAIDPLLNETKTTYTSMAKPKTITDPEGNVVNNAYDERQLLVSVTDAKGAKTAYSYDKEERLKKVTYVDGSFIENFYDKAGRLIKTVDALGYETSYTVDALGRTKEVVNPLNGKTSYTYTPLGKIETETDKNGNKTSYTYNSVGAVETITNPYGGISKYTYNKAGDLLSLEDALGNKTTYTYDIYGKKISETDPNGNKTTYAYDVNGNLTSVTNALGETIYYSYDSCNRLISKKSDVDGEYEIIDLFINEAGQWEAIVDYPKAKLSYEYDKKGQLIAVIDALGNKTESFYDKRGNVSKVTDALGNETTYKYDENNTLIETVNAKGKSTAYKINSLNQVEAVTDALGLKYTYEYNKNGQKIKSTNPLGGESKNIYDKEENIIVLIGPEGGTTELTYDLKGNLATRSTIEGEKVTYTYNALDLVETYENARGQSITYEYDLAGRIVKTISSEGVTSYIYDSNGNVLTVTDGEGTVTRTYDALNRVTSVIDQRENKVSYMYDRAGDLIELTYPDKTKVTYTYDLNHNLLTVTDWTNKTTSYSYDAINRETETLHPDGRKTVKAYDALGNLISLTEYDKTGDVIDKTTYIYDDINRLVVEKYETRSYQYEYIYDDLSRVLSRVTRNTENLEEIETETFNYDGAGNITEAKTADSSKGLSYISKDNRLAAVNKNAYSFDKDGNMIKGTLDGKSVTLTYDIKNHLTQYDSDIYRYDSEDYRLSSTVKMPISGQNTAATSKAMLFESQDISVNLSETDATIDESQSDSVNTEGTKSQDDEETSDDEDPDPQEKEIKAEIGTLFEDGSSTVDESQSEVFIDDIETETEESKIPSDGESTAVVTATESISESLADKLIGGEVSELILEDADVLNATSTVTTVTNNFVYDRENKNLLVRYTSAGVTEKYIYGNGLISAYETKTNTTEYKNYTYDLRGSVTKVFNEAGTLTSKYTYSTYGNRSTVMGDANSPIGYCGREGVLTETNGLIYMRARYYSAELMRFINEDIVLGDISNSNSLNRYTYVEGNPATMIDPFGLCGRNVIKNNDLYDTSIKYRATYDNIIMIEGYTEIVTDDMLKRIINAFELNKNYYEQISYETDMPLELIAAIHYRENAPDYLNSNCNVYLQNGQILGSETTNVPKGLLYYDFVEAGIMAFKNDDQKWKQTVMKVSKECDDITAMVTYSILYNGWQDGISAYAYNGTNLYEKGLFTSDGIYSPEAVDKNLGTFVVINELYTYRRNK